MSSLSVFTAKIVKIYRCGASPCGGQGPKYPATPASPRACTLPGGSLPLPGSPAPSGNSVVETGMLTTSQCQKPLPVGASGSYMVSARLFASAGTSFHTSGGEIFSPVQPKALAVCFRGIVPSPPIAGLEISKADAGEESTVMVRAARMPKTFIQLTPLEALIRQTAIICRFEGFGNRSRLLMLLVGPHRHRRS